MRITRTQLRRIVREEMGRLHETSAGHELMGASLQERLRGLANLFDDEEVNDPDDGVGIDGALLDSVIDDLTGVREGTFWPDT